MIRSTLNGRWDLFRDGSGSAVTGNVPGDVYNDLLNESKIPDPFYRDNEKSLLWIGESDWLYSREFVITEDILQHQYIQLECYGLDTFASVKINNHLVGRSNNMFRTWCWDIKKYVKGGVNTIEVYLTSVMPYLDNILKQSKDYSSIKSGYRIEENSFKYHPCFDQIRKEQCNFGWDWGLMTPTAGIWRDIDIIAYSDAKLEEIIISQQHSPEIGDYVDLTINCHIEADDKNTYNLKAVLYYNGNEVSSTSTVSGCNMTSLAMTIPSPHLWWPNNMGEQYLYDLEFFLLDSTGKIIDCKRQRIGFRTIELDCHEDQWGESFQFIINGIPTFAKGANWIPSDGILGRRNEKTHRKLLEAARDVHMNFIRIWGGGLYEDDHFYDICDELGLCVWQDFMFACERYPLTDSSFIDNVKVEAEQNVARLNTHPSLALWCGNNEIVKKPNDEKHMKAFHNLFEVELCDVVKQYSLDTPYCPGSPYIPASPNGSTYKWTDAGNMHLWNIWGLQEPFTFFRHADNETRFCSEFGFQSFPEPKTLYPVLEKQDHNITSRIIEYRQRAEIGNTALLRYMADWFQMPVSFEMTLWLSQILQMTGIKYGVENWRRKMPRTMGTLYWQLNDYWQGPSWSSIDYDGRWKALHYAARHFYAPVLCSILDDKAARTVDIYLTNDLNREIEGTLCWTVTDLKGNEIAKNQKPVTISERTSTSIQHLDLKEVVERNGYYNTVLWVDFTYNNGCRSENMYFFAPPKHMDIVRKPAIELAAVKTINDSFELTLTTDTVVFWCWLELDGIDAELSDNFFHLRQGVDKQIVIKPEKNISTECFLDQLKIRSLADTMNE